MSNTKTILIAALAAVVLIFLILIGWFVGSYNTLVTLDNNVEGAWAQVESQYQRRADLIPNLVETVKGVRDFEQETYLAVTEARSQWQNAGTQEQQIQAANAMDSALARLLVVVENYPQLKANQNFLALQDSLEGTENRIAVERMRYNDHVRTFNTKIRRIPTNIIAALFGFEKKTYFEAAEGAETVPTVDFE